MRKLKDWALDGLSWLLVVFISLPICALIAFCWLIAAAIKRVENRTFGKVKRV